MLRIVHMQCYVCIVDYLSRIQILAGLQYTFDVTHFDDAQLFQVTTC